MNCLGSKMTAVPTTIRSAIPLVLLCFLIQPTKAQTVSHPSHSHLAWALALHGGAGVARDLSQSERDQLEHSLQHALSIGKEVLGNGGSALDALERVVSTMEDDPQFNAGRGAVFTRAGTHELDASIMDGA